MSTAVHLMTADDVDRHATGDTGFGTLETSRGNLPLDQLDVRATITGLNARVDLTQGFRNPFDEPLEATYVFPLPSRAAVTALRMEADGHVIEGELKERGEARASYDQAVADGKRASIAEEERPGVFTMRVGNILPGERVTVRLTVVGPLPYADGEAEFRFPLVVAPRYIPGTPLPGTPAGDGTAPDTDAVPDASRISPPVLLPGFPNPVRLSAEVEIDPAGLPLSAVRSSLHAVVVDESDGRFTVRLQPGERADRDFVLRLGLGAEDAVTSSLAVLPDGEGGDGTFALTILPPAAVGQARPRDVVLVLDRSGSMAGWKMVAARRAAARIVDTLGDADRFTVLTFDNVVDAAPDSGLVAATDRNRFRAVEHLAGVAARGGTEMAAPLSRAADLLRGQDDDPGRDRVLVLVTDGQVGNEDQLLRTLTPQLGGVRVHTVGVDTAVNEAFLRRLAALGGGRCELVESESRLDEAMGNIHRRIASPLVTDLALHAEVLDLDTAMVSPARLPDLFPGAPVVVTGRFRGTPAGAVTVSGRRGGAEWRKTVPAVASTNPSLAAVWARGRVRDLEDRYVTAEAMYPSSGELPELEREIVATSLRFGVLCRFTAFVAVDARVVNEGGTVRRITQPVDLPQGWEAPLAQGARPGAAPMLAAMPAGYAGAPPSFAPQARPAAPARMMRTAAAQRPAPILPPTAPEPLVTFAAEQLAALRAAGTGSVADRTQFLARLAEQLTALITRLERQAADDVLRPLRELLAALTGPVTGEIDLDHRWLHALDVLEAISSHPTGNPKRPFWKR